MFDELGQKLDGALKKLRQRGVLTEPMIKEGLREVRRVLLEADVNFQVTREFLGRVQERALGESVLKAVSPGQQIVNLRPDDLIGQIIEAGGADQSGQPDDDLPANRRFGCFVRRVLIHPSRLPPALPGMPCARPAAVALEAAGRSNP